MSLLYRYPYRFTPDFLKNTLAMLLGAASVGSYPQAVVPLQVFIGIYRVIQGVANSVENSNSYDMFR